MMPSGYEWIIVLVIVLLIFGGAKLPKLARSLGEARREFENANKTESGALPPTDTGTIPPTSTTREADIARREAELARREAELRDRETH